MATVAATMITMVVVVVVLVMMRMVGKISTRRRASVVWVECVALVAVWASTTAAAAAAAAAAAVVVVVVVVVVTAAVTGRRSTPSTVPTALSATQCSTRGLEKTAMGMGKAMGMTRQNWMRDWSWSWSWSWSWG
jgi:hypothetical protein